MPGNLAMAIAIVLCGNAAEAGAPPAGTLRTPAEVQSAHASLHIESDPPDAHVYLHGPLGTGSEVLIGPCTDHCTVDLIAGTYGIEAGLEHRHLAYASRQVTLDRGVALDLRVGVHRNTVRRAITVTSLGTALACLVGFFAVGATDWPDFPEGWPRKRAAATGLMVGMLTGAVAAVATMVLTDEVVVEAEPTARRGGGS